ncbi:hypothetical protein RAD16_34135 [Bradyrhizobium sp. 18BD]
MLLAPGGERQWARRRATSLEASSFDNNIHVGEEFDPMLRRESLHRAPQEKRLAARVPDLDIFSQALVERLNGGWRITDKGWTVLDFIENRSSGPQTERDAPVEDLSTTEPAPRFIASTRVGRSQRLQRRSAARARARAKAS